MKRLLAFILLFGSSLALLLWIDRQRRAEQQEQGAETPQVDQPVVLNGPDVLTGAETQAQGEQGQDPDESLDEPDPQRMISLGGQGRYTRFGPQTPAGREVRWVLAWQDSHPGTEDQVELVDVLLEVFDEETGGLTAQLEAESGVMIASEGEKLTEIELGERVLLRDIVFDLFEPNSEEVVGLRLTAPSMHLEMVDGAERFWTDESAVIESEELLATGPGLEVLLREGLLSIPREGHVEVDLADDGKLELDSTGELVLQRRPPEGPGPAKLIAKGGAVLTGRGERPFSLRGTTIELFGRSSEESSGLSDEGFSLEHVLALGTARLRSGAVETDGELARLVLRPDGTRVVTIEGEPVARIYSQAFQSELELAGEGMADAPIVVSGAREIVLESAEGQPSSWRAPGPARILWGDWALQAEGGVDGGSSADGAIASLHAYDEVRLSGEDQSELRCPELFARWYRREGEQALLQLEASAPAHVNGVSSGGAPFRLVTEGTLAVDQRGELWHVRRAEGVNLLVEGDSSRRMRAGLVSAFDPQTLAFEASSGVQFDGLAAGEVLSGHGERASSTGEGHLLLLGTPRAPATFQHALGSGRALAVERLEERLYADGAVLLNATRDAFELQLACDALEGVQGVTLAGDEQRLQATATGRVRAHIVQHGASELEGGTAYDLDCARLTLERRRMLDGEELLARHTSLVASTVTRGTLQRLQAENTQSDRWTLECATLTAERAEGREGRLAAESVLATGDVVAQLESQQGTTVSGRGHELSIGQERIGRLSARPGERVIVEGALPGGTTPFELTASVAEFTAMFLRALEPAIVIERMLQPKVEGGEPRRSPVHASALELLGAPTELLLLGQAHIVGELDETRAWNLEAGKVRLAGPAQRMLDDPTASSRDDVGGLESMQAWDGFRLELGDSTVATGDRLGVDAQARLLHAEGEPTVLSTAGMLLRTTEFDYDLVTSTVRTGPGRLGPLLPVARAPLMDQQAAPQAERRP